MIDYHRQRRVAEALLDCGIGHSVQEDAMEIAADILEALDEHDKLEREKKSRKFEREACWHLGAKGFSKAKGNGTFEIEYICPDCNSSWINKTSITDI